MSLKPSAPHGVSGGELVTVVHLPLLERSKRRSGFYLRGHTNDVNALRFTPNGRSLISASSDRTVRLWDLNTEKCSIVMRGHNGGVLRAALSGNGNLLATSALVIQKSDFVGEIKVWAVSKPSSDKASTASSREAGITAFQRGYYLSAIESFSDCIDALEGKPLADSYRFRGRCYEKRHDRDAAIRDYGQALRIDPDDTQAMVWRARLYRHRKEYGPALQQFENAIALEADCAEAWNGAAWLLATATEPDHRDGRRAIRFAKKACDLTDNKDASCRNTLAAAFAEIGEFAAARGAQKSAIAALPNDTSPLRVKDYQRRLDLYEREEAYRDHFGGMYYDFDG